MLIRELTNIVRLFSPRGMVRLKWALRMAAARWKRARSKARYIAVTGSSAKSTTAALLAHILQADGPVTKLVVRNGFRDIVKTVLGTGGMEKYVAVEVAISVSGHVRAVADIIRPDIAIITLVGIEHYSIHRSREAIAHEKGALVEAVRPGGLAILNGDDEHVMAMSRRTHERVVTFARHAHADYRATPVLPSFPGGLDVGIDTPDGQMTARTGFLGEHFWLSTVAAVAAARELGISSELIEQRISTFPGLFGRCQLLETRDGPQFILDVVKAPWQSLGLAFAIMENTGDRRKRIVLGHISDYPGNPKPKYRDAYRAAVKAAAQVIFVGEHAHRSQATNADRQLGRFKEFSTPKAAYEYLRSDAQRDEIILLKSSANLHLERLALAWDHDVKCWETHCGVRTDCVTCGLYGHPFREHRAIRRRRRQRHRLARLMPWKR